MNLKASAVALALAALPLGADAAGMGKITVLSVLGQPLRAEIDLSASREEIPSLSARVASSDAFRQAGIDFPTLMLGIKVSVDKRADGRPYLILKSDQAINEPFLDVLLEMNWASGRLMREYTFLLDPPEALQKPAPQAVPVTPPIAINAPPAPSAAALPEARREAPVAKPTESAAPARKPAEEMTGARTAKAAPAQEAESLSGATHQVKRGDTLSKIAAETRPEGVNLDQMLVALFRSNKDAFEDSNINRLKTGKILAIPDHDTAAAVNPAEAKEFVVAQSVDFDAYRKKLAAAIAGAPAKEEAPKQAVSGKITPKVEDKAPMPAPGKDKLEISKSAAAKSAATGRGVAAIEEDLVAREKALKEATTRIAELDKNLADMKKLLELKSQTMAEAQKQAQAPKPAAAPVAPEAKKPEVTPAAAPVPQAPAVQAEKSVEKPAEQPTEAVASAKPAELPTPAPAAEKPAPAEAKPAAPKKVAPPPPPPAPEPSFIDDNPELVFGGGGIVALLLGYLGFSKWRKKREETQPDTAGPISQSEPSINSVFGSTGGQIVDTGSAAVSSLDTDFSVAGVGGATDTNEGVDPIAEADVYMAYGRNAQAEEILLDALKTDPSRHAIHLKLLEIYAARKSLKQFETIAADLHSQTGGSGDDWEQAAALGLQIDPDNSLYGQKPKAAVEAFNPAATMVLSSHELSNLAGNIPQAGEESAMQAADMMAPATTLASEQPAEEVPESLDFELDLDSGTASADGETLDLGAPLEGSTATTDDFAIDFDLGGDKAPALPSLAGVPETGAAPQLDDNIIDFNLDSVAPAQALAESTPPEVKTLESADEAPLNFDLGLSGDAAMAAPALQTGGVDLSSISLDLDDNLKAAPKLEIPPLTPAAASLTASAAPAAAAAAPAAASDDAASQEVATKLELAQAYEEMGDKDGARELLQEVLNEGNEAQKIAARSKLEQLGQG